MKHLLGLLRHSRFRLGFAALAACAVILVGCGRSQGPAKKETDPTKVEQKRQEESKQFDRERQGK